MGDIFKIVVGSVLAVLGLLFLPVFVALCGGIAGWVVGLFFGSTILAFFAQLGITGMSMFQIGATLGFIGSFFNSFTQVSK